jgi:hypothetical protein
MKPSTVRDLDRISKTWMGEPRTHVIWCWKEEIDSVFEARKRALIESGQARESDRFVAFTWRRGDDKDSDGAAPSP